MMKFCAATAKEYGVPITVSLNPIMVDGTGMCGACRVTLVGRDQVRLRRRARLRRPCGQLGRAHEPAARLRRRRARRCRVREECSCHRRRHAGPPEPRTGPHAPHAHRCPSVIRRARGTFDEVGSATPPSRPAPRPSAACSARTRPASRAVRSTSTSRASSAPSSTATGPMVSPCSRSATRFRRSADASARRRSSARPPACWPRRASRSRSAPRALPRRLRSGLRPWSIAASRGGRADGQAVRGRRQRAGGAGMRGRAGKAWPRGDDLRVAARGGRRAHYGIPEFRLPKAIVRPRSRRSSDGRRDRDRLRRRARHGRELMTRRATTPCSSAAGRGCRSSWASPARTSTASTRQTSSSRASTSCVPTSSRAPTRRCGAGARSRSSAAATSRWTRREPRSVSAPRRSSSSTAAPKTRCRRAGRGPPRPEEGVEFKMLCSPVEIVGMTGWVTGHRRDAHGARRAGRAVAGSGVRDGSEFEIDCDTVIMAVGTRANPLLSRPHRASSSTARLRHHRRDGCDDRCGGLRRRRHRDRLGDRHPRDGSGQDRRRGDGCVAAWLGKRQ
jgi:hypothetical protein